MLLPVAAAAHRPIEIDDIMHVLSARLHDHIARRESWFGRFATRVHSENGKPVAAGTFYLGRRATVMPSMDALPPSCGRPELWRPGPCPAVCCMGTTVAWTVLVSPPRTYSVEIVVSGDMAAIRSRLERQKSEPDAGSVDPRYRSCGHASDSGRLLPRALSVRAPAA